MGKHTCKLGKHILKLQRFTPWWSHIHRLGITQFLIEGGLARLEEVRDSDGKLENIYVRVSSPALFIFQKQESAIDLYLEFYVSRSTARRFYPKARMLWANFWSSSKYAKALRTVQVQRHIIRNWLRPYRAGTGKFGIWFWRRNWCVDVISPRLRNACWFLAFLAEEDFCTTKHIRGRWGGPVKGVSAHAGWGDRELHWKEAVKEFYYVWFVVCMKKC